MAGEALNHNISLLPSLSATVQVCTGRLLAVESQHYQTVTVLVFTDDGLWLISGGEDGRVLVWSLRQ